MANHGALMQSQFAKLMATGSEFEEARKVVIFLSSLISHNKYAQIIASINTVPERMSTCLYVTKIFVEECS